MPDQDPDRLLDVIVAVYDNVDDAKADYKTLKDIYKDLGTSAHFEAAVLKKTDKGKPKIVDTYEAETRHDALKGLGFGLAGGLLAAIFPAVGITAALAAGGAGGAAIGAMVGHVDGAIPRDDLRSMADLLYPSEAGLVVVYETSLEDQIEKNLKAINHVKAALADMSAEDLADAMREANA